MHCCEHEITQSGGRHSWPHCNSPTAIIIQQGSCVSTNHGKNRDEHFHHLTNQSLGMRFFFKLFRTVLPAISEASLRLLVVSHSAAWHFLGFRGKEGGLWGESFRDKALVSMRRIYPPRGSMSLVGSQIKYLLS